MKQFFKFMFASMVGFLLVSIISFFFFMMAFMSLLSFSKKDVVVVPENSVLHMRLNRPLPDRTPVEPSFFQDPNDFSLNPDPGLNDILINIDKAKNDTHIKGIFLDLEYVPAGFSTIREIRNALIDFKESGKFIVSYGERYSQGAYYLASVSDSVFLNPEGSLLFKGLYAELMFFKGTLEKLDIEAQIIRPRGNKYKSAVEPFFLDKMSPASRAQTEKFVQAIWDQITEEISASRGVEQERLNQIADRLLIRKALDAKENGLVDELLFKDGVLEELRGRLDIAAGEGISFMSLKKYTDAPRRAGKVKVTENNIAVVYASGEIRGGKGDDATIGSERITAAIRQARRDRKVKAIVLRVNSPGGDALASEVILREVILAKEEKPVVASLGNVAASGGYYIACRADRIIAAPSTITGSIGVFGLIPNLKHFLNNKLGVTTDNVKTNENAGFLTANRALTAYEREVIQDHVENIYQTFLGHVARGRGMTVEEVDKIGQGRVWSGIDAREIGLVDEFGGLEKAIEVAAEMAEIEDYRIISLPKQKELIYQILEEITGEKSARLIRNELGPHYKYYRYLRELTALNGVQARMPYQLDID
ncbi:MAG: signal peptide peptidase SppA [Candidatus Krumholzibacteriota bacterium]|nr:signal peptide peptidase SppA [Candidatus Krumholzibacteriota bacterium]